MKSSSKLAEGETPFQNGEKVIKKINASICLTMLEECLVTLKDTNTFPKHIIWNTIKLMCSDSVGSCFSWGFGWFSPVCFTTEIYLIVFSPVGCLKGKWRHFYVVKAQVPYKSLHCKKHQGFLWSLWRPYEDVITTLWKFCKVLQ